MKLSKKFIVLLLLTAICVIQSRYKSKNRLIDAEPYVQFARLPYCSPTRLSNPTCDVCHKIGFQGYSVENVFTYDRDVDGRPITISMTFSKNSDGRELVVSFGGPKTEDIMYIQSLYSSGFINVNESKIEKGFWDIYESSIKDDLISRLEVSNYRDLVFVGHSVGGSLAVLAAYDVGASDLNIPKPHVYVFGALTVGDRTFMKHFKNLANVVRIKKNDDLYMQFPTCLITGIDSGTCFEDYSTLLDIYPTYRPYLSVAYPLYHGSWPSPFYTSYYGGHPYYGFYHPGGLYGSIYDYPSTYGYGYGNVYGYGYDYGRDPTLIDDPSDTYKAPLNKDREPEEEPIPALNNKKNDHSISQFQGLDNIAKVQHTIKNLKGLINEDRDTGIVNDFNKPRVNYRRENNNKDNEKENYWDEAEEDQYDSGESDYEASSDGESSRESSNESSNYLNNSETNKNRKNNYARNNSGLDYSSNPESSYESSNVNNSGANRYRNNHTTNNSGMYESSYSQPSYESGSASYNSPSHINNSSRSSSISTNFLETSIKRRSLLKYRRSYRKAFKGYFNELENCRIHGKSANCKLDPKTHKTYYGVDIENCY